MSQEFATIKIQRFSTPDGKPTCAIGTGKDESCKFLGARNFGNVPVCMFGENQDLRRDGGYGFIEPHKDCAIWR